MRKMYVLENFASQGVRYAKGKMIDMDKALADRFEKEGFLVDALTHLGIEAPTVDMTKYVAVEEHKKAQDEIKALNKKIAQLEKELSEKVVEPVKEETPAEKSTTKKKA